MRITTLSSRELNQDIGRAKRATHDGPVVITDRGKPAHVLMTYEAWRKMDQKPRSLVDALSMPGLSNIDFEPPRLSLDLQDTGF